MEIKEELSQREYNEINIRERVLTQMLASAFASGAQLKSTEQIIAHADRFVDYILNGKK